MYDKNHTGAKMEDPQVIGRVNTTSSSTDLEYLVCTTMDWTPPLEFNHVCMITYVQSMRSSDIFQSTDELHNC